MLDRPYFIVFGRVAPDVQDPDRRQEREQNAADQDKKIPAARILTTLGSWRIQYRCRIVVADNGIRRNSCLCPVVIHAAVLLGLFRYN